MTCRVCGHETVKARGMCNTCYKYWRINGTDRPRWCYDRQVFCKTCAQSKVHAKGECTACYNYRLKHGKRRPAHRWGEQCKVCGAPRLTGKYTRGRCDSCRTYYARHGVERPPHLWKRRCDCGNVATRFDVELRMLTTDKELPKVERYDLCEDCYQLEMGE